MLRARQLRAGIPRTLDSLCDHILNHGGDTEVSAAMLADALRDFLGPSATAAEAWLGRIQHADRGEGTVVLPPLPDPPVRELRSGRSSGDTTPGDDTAPDGSAADTGPPVADAAGDETEGGGGLAAPGASRLRCYTVTVLRR